MAHPSESPAHRSVTMDELDSQGTVVRELSESQAAAVSQTGLIDVRPELDGRWRLLPRGRVGAVRLDGLQIQVRPKERVGLTRLLFLLGYARDPGFRPEDVAGDDEPDLWPAIAESLARLAERATGTGVLQGYRTVEEPLRVVRGRIDLGKQIRRHPGFVVPVEVIHDDFTVDIPENQILRSAIRTVLAVPRLRPSAAARLAHVDNRLSEVSLLNRGVVPAWRPTRLNGRYHAALRLAEVILANASTEPGTGHVQVAAFVVDMAKVFEDFVGTALTEALRAFPGVTHLQYATHLDEGGAYERPGIPMYVDVVHTVNRAPRLVFDAKYKTAGPNDRYPNADHYQMLAYCTALQTPTSWLVYAGGREPRTHRIRNSGVQVTEYPLDLAASPDDLLEQTQELAERAWLRSAVRDATESSPQLRAGRS